MNYSNHPLNNKVILCTEENKGKPLKDFFERNEINTRQFNFNSTGVLYGLINGNFGAWLTDTIKENTYEVIALELHLKKPNPQPQPPKPKVDFQTRALMAAIVYNSSTGLTEQKAVELTDLLIQELEK